MPSCAKIEKRASAEVQLMDNTTPIRQVIVAVEHKIRNLEKRKGKLESYRDLQKSGKDLTTDQKIAVSKYDEVTQCLDFARELFKQVHAISAMWEKDQKKVVRKETATRIQNEVTKVKEVLVIQDTLEGLRDEQAREDFLTGSNGAAKLEKKELDLLDQLYASSTVKRVPGSNMEAYLASAQKAADHLISTVDGKPKSFCDTNYERVRSILQVVHNSGYFDKQFGTGEKVDEAAAVGVGEEVVKNGLESPREGEPKDVEVGKELEKVADPPQQQPPVPTFIPEVPHGQAAAAAAAAAPIVPQMMIPQPITTIIPPQGGAASTAAPPLVGIAGAPSPLMNPGHMRAMEQSYFKHQQQYMQQMRPINEIIGGSAYYFLQDSELDSPDVVTSVAAPVAAAPQQPPLAVVAAPTAAPQIPPQGVLSPAIPIPSQTFTNQTYSTMVPPQTAYPGVKPAANAPITVNPTPVPAPEHHAPVHIPGFVTARPIVPTSVVAAQGNQPAPSGGGGASGGGSVPPPVSQYASDRNQMMAQQPVATSAAQPTPTKVPVVEKKEEPPVQEEPLTITQWTAEDSAAVTKKVEESTNWADQVNEASAKEWSGTDSTMGGGGDNQFGGSWQPEGTTTSSTGGYSGRRGYSSGGHMRRRGGMHNNSGMGYRSSRGGNGGGYHQNGSGSNTNRSGGGGSTFYRNNDPNYYQNQNGGTSGGYHNGGGNGGSSSYKGRSNVRPSGGRGERTNFDRRDNRAPRSSGGFQGPTRSTNTAGQND
uniref:Putative caprin n=1 Tax=Lutzomyia longipalpis TaxID=7200 RepID=A0A7G3ACP3_LUTLO